MIVETLFSLFVSLGFGILFNVPKNRLVYVALTGLLGGITYKLLIYFSYGEGVALFCASLVISLLAEIFARISHCPTTIFLICALVLLVPGGGMYYTMLAIVNSDYISALNIGFNTIISACLIVIACTLVSSIFYAINHFRFKTNR